MTINPDHTKEKTLIGRRELVDFPELGLFQIVSKIDTGAYTSAIHCHDVREVIQDNKKTLRFRILDPSHKNYHDKELQFSEYSAKKIKNSFGEWERRYVVKTLIVLAGRKIRARISLSDRGNMRYPVLIGRKILKHRFIIDVSILKVPEEIKTKN
jgi:hypothetical protein